MIYRRAIVDGHADLAAFCSAKTDAEGRYDCPRLRTGNYIVAVRVAQPESAPVSPSAQVATIEAATTVYPLMFYPSVRTLAEAQSITLHDAQSAYADLTVASEQAESLHGVLPGAPKLALVSILAHSGGFDLPVSSRVKYSPQTGRFVVSAVSPGSYMISADWVADAQTHHAKAVVRVGSESDREVKLTEWKIVDVKGYLHYDSSTTIPLPTNIELIAAGVGKQPHYNVQVARDGSFVFQHLPEGSYQLQTQHGESAYVRAVSIRGKEVSSHNISLSSDLASFPLDVQLGQTEADVSGSLGETGFVAGSSGVVVQPLLGQPQPVLADNNRQFELSHLPPGDYRIYAWSDLGDVEFQNPTYLEHFIDKSKAVSVDEKGRVHEDEMPLIESN